METRNSTDLDVLPALSGIEESRKRVEELKAKLVRLDNLQKEYETDPSFREAVKGVDEPLSVSIEKEREQTLKRLEQAQIRRAGYVFG